MSSHIHYNRHPNQNPLIPAVGISGVNGELVAILYDCVRDLLFQVVALTWLDVSAGCLNTPVVFMLWLLLHHRLFLKELPADGPLPRANLQKIFETGGAIPHYQNLKDYSICRWPVRAWLTSEASVLPTVSLEKKRQLEEEARCAPHKRAKQ